MTLYIVIPCYNEEEVLNETASRLLQKMQSLLSCGKIDEKSKILFVNDGSKDNTWQIIETLHKSNGIFSGISLSRNRGHQNALLAGLDYATDFADAVISMDADLQDDINAVDEMLDKFYGGADIVYGVRNSRKTDTFFKRFTAESFYKVMDKLGAKVIFNHADYRLMSKRALQGLKEFKEVNLFLRGLVPMIGYKSEIVLYDRAKRFAGTSKYPLKKMLSFAYEGITSMSGKLISIIRNFGIILGSLGFIATVVTLCLINVIYNSALWILLSFIAFNTGLILTAIGIVGDYVAKTYLETKHRPKYIIEKILNS